MERFIFAGILCTIIALSGYSYAQLFIESDTVYVAKQFTTTNSDMPNKANSPSGNIKEGLREIPWGIIAETLLVFFIAFIIIKYVITLPLETIAEHRSNWRMPIKRTLPIIQVFWWIFTTYLIIHWFFDLSSFVAFAASAGIAIGFASQDILKNIFGGIMILFDRPFQVGDKIEVGNYYGEVVQIGLRTVRIVTPDDSQVSIPNGEIMNQAVSNANSGSSDCQVVAEFFLPIHIDLVKTKKIAYHAAAVSRYVYLNKPISVIFQNQIHHGKAIIKMRLKAYVLDIRYEFPFASEMTETVVEELINSDLIKPTDGMWMNNGVGILCG